MLAHHSRRKAFSAFVSTTLRFWDGTSFSSSVVKECVGHRLHHHHHHHHHQNARRLDTHWTTLAECHRHNARRHHHPACHAPSARRAHVGTKKAFSSSSSSSSSSTSSSRSQSKTSISDKNQNMLYYLLAITSFTVGASYASVPLYRAFCRATGFGGTTQRKSIEEKIQEREQMDKSVLEKAKKRSVEVTFNADVAEGLPWKFTPTQKKVTVTPGETVLAFYTAENKSSSPITGVATYNVQPGKAGQYFNKIQCFCFEEQRLRAKEKVDMPVFFYLDPEFASDRGMEDVNSLVLSYTFFQSEDFDGDEYDEARDWNERGEGEGGVKLHGGGGGGADGKKKEVFVTR